MTNTVAVLLAAYNGLEWLDEQLQSILQQEDVVLHVFISVDLSDDGTYTWCKKQESQYQNISVLDYGERFGGAAKNFYRLIRDVDFSEFDYVSLSDQDDIWLANKLSSAISEIEQKQLEGYSSDVIAFWNDGREKLVKKSYPQKKFDHYFEAAGPGCTYVLTKNAMLEFKGFLNTNWLVVNNVSLHDWMIYSYFRSNDFKWHIDSVPLMRYRQHERNQVGSNLGLKAAIVRLGMIKNKWYSGQVNRIVNLFEVGASLKLNRRFLITHFLELRRRPRDAFILMIMLLAGIY